MSNPPPRLHDALVHNGRRQEFEIAHLELTVLFDQNDLDVDCSLLRRFKTSGSVENTWSILGARGGPCAASTYCIRYANCSAVTFPNGFNSFC